MLAHRIRKSSRSDSSTCTSASEERPPRSAANRSCVSFGLSVNSSSNWSTTRSASPCPPRHRLTADAKRSLSPRSISSSTPQQLRRSPPRPRPAPGVSAWARPRKGRRPGVAQAVAQPSGPRGDDPRPHERGLARARGADHRQELRFCSRSPERLDLGLSPEEARRVLLREARKARVGAPLLHLLQERRPRRRREHRLQRHRRRRAPTGTAPPVPSPGTAARSPTPPAGSHAPGTPAPPASPPGSPSASRTAVSRRNGCLPARSSYSTTPSEKTSVRASTASPRTCSGDM